MIHAAFVVVIVLVFVRLFFEKGVQDSSLTNLPRRVGYRLTGYESISIEQYRGLKIILESALDYAHSEGSRPKGITEKHIDGGRDLFGVAGLTRQTTSCFVRVSQRRDCCCYHVEIQRTWCYREETFDEMGSDRTVSVNGWTSHSGTLNSLPTCLTNEEDAK